MADLPHTLIIGDQFADQLYGAFQQIPGTGAMWEDPFGYAMLDQWSDGKAIKKTWDKVAKGGDAQHQLDRMPDTALVSLGRGDILIDSVDKPEHIKSLSDDAGKIVDQLKSVGIKTVVWVLPPAIKNEGGGRAAIAEALAAKGVRVFNAADKWNDPSLRGDPPTRLSDDMIQQIAGAVAAWMPLGSFASNAGAAGLGLGTGNSASTDIPPGAAGSPTPSSFLGRLSRPTKFAIGGGIVLAIGGAVYAARGRYG